MLGTSIKLGNLVYREKENTLFAVFLFARDVKTQDKEIAERDFRANLAASGLDDVKAVFQYRQADFGASSEHDHAELVRLHVRVKTFLTREFGILTLDLQDGDITVEKQDSDFTINVYLPAQSIEYIQTNKTFKQFAEKLHDENFCKFEFFFTAKHAPAGNVAALDKLKDYMSQDMASRNESSAVSKVLPVKKVEYWLGAPIKHRPIKIEFLRVSAEPQITAGEIRFLTKREYVKKPVQSSAATAESPPAPEERKTYWSFVLDDGKDRVNCVFFPSDKTFAKFEKLVNGTTIAVTGFYSQRNGRTSLRVNGVSFCEM